MLGGVRAPLGSPEFSSFLLQAQSSRAKIIGFALAGADLINSIKQANEFGIVAGGQSLATPLMFVTDVKSIGLKLAHGLVLAAPFYWALNDETRAWSKRFSARFDGKAPTFLQAANYSVTLQYLKSIAAAKSKNATEVMATMHELPTNDPVFGAGRLSTNNRNVHPLYLFKIKSPAESKGDWDVHNLVKIIPADHAVRSEAESNCKLVKR